VTPEKESFRKKAYLIVGVVRMREPAELVIGKNQTAGQSVRARHRP
jgi:hypothetical protein